MEETSTDYPRGAQTEFLILVILLPLLAVISVILFLVFCYCNQFYKKLIPYCHCGRKKQKVQHDSECTATTSDSYSNSYNNNSLQNPTNDHIPDSNNSTKIETGEAETTNQETAPDLSEVVVIVDAGFDADGPAGPPLDHSPSLSTRKRFSLVASETKDESIKKGKKSIDPLPESVVPKPVVSVSVSVPNPVASIERKIKAVANTKNSGVILAVDATPRACGGYCIRKEFQVCEFYAIGMDRLPWRLHNLSRRGNAAEFEMKNLMYALLNWEETILESGKLWVYTDNMAIKGKGIGNAYGSTVRAYLYHLQTCHAVRIMNFKNHHVNRHKSEETFHKYIQPADHLSRRKMNDFYEHMEIYFSDVIYLIRDDNFFKVEQQMDKWVRERCATCGFRIRHTASLRETNKQRANL